MKKLNVIVFGGSGFIGSHVADLLSNNNYNVTIYDLEKSKYLKKNQKMIVGDINGAITSLNLLSNPTQIGPNGNLVTVHEFADGEELFLYIYESEQDVTYFDATTETITDIRLQSQYKKKWI